MPGGKCLFQVSWLEKNEYKEWLTEHSNRRKAHCKFCRKDLDIASMGESAIKAHMKGAKHNNLLKAKKKSTGLIKEMFVPAATSESYMEPFYCGAVDEQMPETDPPSKLTRKREDYICWADYFMAVASLTALRSKDPNSQVGACIVNEENKIVGVGYNGMPNGCNDDFLPWAREADDVLDTKYPYVCHAEMNAICNKNSADLKGCTIYVALFPCNECAKLIIQSRIREVVYMSDKYSNTSNVIAAKRLFDMSGVIYRQHVPVHSRIVIDLNKINNCVQSCNNQQ